MAITLGAANPKIINWSKNPIPVTLHTDLDVAANNVRIRLWIALFIGATIPQFFLEETPDADGNVVFDLSGSIDDAMNNEWQSVNDLPPLNTIHAIDKSPIILTIAYIEIQNNIEISFEGLNSLIVETDPPFLYVLQGGTNAESIMTGYDYWTSGFELATYPTLNPFLTWQNRSRTSDKKAICPLHFLLNHDVDGVYGKFTFYMYDLAIGTFETATTGSFGQWRVLCMNAGLLPYTESGELDLTTIETGTNIITGYVFQLFNSTDEAISETRYFELDNLYHKNANYFIFQNSLNGFDEVRFIGETESKIDTDRSTSTFSNSNQSQAVPPLGIRSTTATAEQYSIKINTGSITESEADLIRELCNSPRIFRYHPIAGKTVRFVPVELTEKSKTLIKSTDYLNHLQLEFANQFKNSVYTPQRIIDNF